jgi:hypothetical protein
MTILAAIKREELEKELGKLNHKLNGVRFCRKSVKPFCRSSDSYH